MPPRHILLLANVTSSGPRLLAKAAELAAEAPTRFTLLVPATYDGSARSLTFEEKEIWQVAESRMKAGVQALHDRGLDADGQVGFHDPLTAVQDLLRTERVDSIVVSTLNARSSRWLERGLPTRIARETGLPVLHVEAAEATAPTPA
jgi:hypothetical protein